MLLPLAMAISLQAPIGFYIGTYTSKDGSKGIYHATLDTASGELTTPKLAVEAEGPSFLAIRGQNLYAVLEPTDGTVAAYWIHADSTLTILNTQTFKGLNPCHLAVDPKGNQLLVAAYSGGSVAAFSMFEDGSIRRASAVFQNEGSGPDKSRQEAPHMHAVQFGPNGKAYACDLGTDEIVVFDGDLKKIGAGKAPAGGGPRHLEIDAKGKFLYANNEMANSVSVYELDANGIPALIQTISTLPAGEPNSGTTAELHLHPSGKWLYVSNRGHDSIAVYKVLGDGKLELVEIAKVGVATPRGFDIDPSGNWLVVAGQSSHDLTSMKIDPGSGKLTGSGFKVKLDQPVCVLFTR